MLSKSWAGGFARRAIKAARRAIDYIYQETLAISGHALSWRCCIG